MSIANCCLDRCLIVFFNHQVIALQAQVEAQNQVVRKLEEKERLLQNNLSTIEKELTLKQVSHHLNCQLTRTII